MSRAIFISYRRQDSAPSARGLRDELRRAFKNPVFLDTEEIGIGDVWAAEIRNALDSAAVLILVIGPTWLRVHDEHGRRRIDSKEDWINIEIRECLKNSTPIIPLLVNNGLMPPQHGLPDEIKPVTEYQYMTLTDEFWQRDVDILIDKLSHKPFGFERNGEKLPLPVLNLTPKYLPGALTEAEIESALAELSKWKLEVSPMPGQYPKQRTEICRHYQFEKFHLAIEFMMACVPVIVAKKHHPRWQNVFRTVTVWLSTWDIGNKVTHIDIELAKSMDETYRKMNALSDK